MSYSNDYPLRLSARDSRGHDSGRIHAVQSQLTHNALSLHPEMVMLSLCGSTFGVNGTVSHVIGPTCHKCRLIIESRKATVK